MTFAFSFTQAASIAFSATAQETITVDGSGTAVAVVVPPLIAPPPTYYLLTASSERLKAEGGYWLTMEHV